MSKLLASITPEEHIEREIEEGFCVLLLRSRGGDKQQQQLGTWETVHDVTKKSLEV